MILFPAALKGNNLPRIVDSQILNDLDLPIQGQGMRDFPRQLYTLQQKSGMLST